MRKTNEEILQEYLESRQIKDLDENMREMFLMCVEAARSDEPRINSGTHLWDYLMICDDDDDFDSYYGPDYFNELS